MLSTLAPVTDERLVAPYIPRRQNEAECAMVFVCGSRLLT